MCAPSCVKNIFLRIYKLFGTSCCTAAHKLLDSWKLSHCKTYLLSRNHFYHSWTATGSDAIRLMRNDWREITLFYKNNFIKTRVSFFAQNLRTIPASAEKQSLKFSIKIVNKTAASAAPSQRAFCFTLQHVQL